jgi:hypothetical protein
MIIKVGGTAKEGDCVAIEHRSAAALPIAAALAGSWT